MTRNAAHDTPPTDSGPPIRTFRPSYLRHLQAANLSPTTINTYLEAFDQLDHFLELADLPQRARAIGREHLEAFIADQLAR